MPLKFVKFGRTLLVVLLLLPSLFILFGSYDSLGKEHEKKDKAKQTSFKSKAPKHKPAKNQQKIVVRPLIRKKLLLYCLVTQ